MFAYLADFSALYTYFITHIGSLGLQLGEEATDLLAQLLVVGVHLFTVGRETGVIFASFVFVDSVLVALVEGAAPVLCALDLLQEARHAHTTLARFILKRQIKHP